MEINQMQRNFIKSTVIVIIVSVTKLIAQLFEEVWTLLFTIPLKKTVIQLINIENE